VKNIAELDFNIIETEDSQKAKFQRVNNVYSENSFGVTGRENNVELTFNVSVSLEPRTLKYGRDVKPYYRGSFEWYSGDGAWYCSGGLWFNTDKELMDYDGCFSLSEEVMDCLEAMGWNVDEMRD
tara:strand:+ start:2363 stop:2737 length:375 start_codon:yes stop_codon:yes gene_type:complete